MCMGFVFRARRRIGASTWLNVSKTGASVSKRLGPVTVNSRGRVTVRLLPGLTWRSGR